MAAPQRQRFFTVEEYLARERAAEERHEYIDGEIRAMAGESLEHGRISTNLMVELGSQLRGSPCEVVSKDMKVRSSASPKTKTRRPPKDFFSYPDFVIFCGAPVFHDSFRDVLLNPQVIIEVLSDSTEAFDRGEKFIRYRTYNDTLTDYILVSQKRPFIEHFVRQPDGKWLMSATSGLSDSLHIAALGCELKLADVYDRVEFPTLVIPIETSELDQSTQE
jgi:Uma2 family endonuclease